MTKHLATIVLLGSLAIPGAALAKPNQNDRQNAAQECREERGTTETSRAAFRVSRRAKDEEAERRSAHSEAVEECRRLHPRGQGKPETGKANEFGKCVSARASTKEAEADRRDQAEIRRRHRAAARRAQG